DVVDEHHPLTGLELSLDAPPGAVALFLPPRIDEGHPAREARRDRQGQAGVGDAADAVATAASHFRGHQRADLLEHVGERDDHAEIDVEGRDDARLERELAEADGPDLEEAPDQRLVRAGGHDAISCRTAATAAAGSEAAVIGRPTTR